MSDNVNDATMKRVEAHLEYYKEHYKNDWVGIFLQGSQNYGLDYEKSDVDTKIIVLPSLEDIVLGNKPISKTMVLPNNEHCDVKDIRLMFNALKKQNINFLEILFTEYNLLNHDYSHLFAPILRRREAVAHYDNYAALHCMFGMIVEKRNSLCKMTPAKRATIEEYGYDGKELCHIGRLLEFIERYFVHNEPFEKCLKSAQRERLMSYKRNLVSCEDAQAIADNALETATSIANEYESSHAPQISQWTGELLHDVVLGIFRKSFSKDLLLYKQIIYGHCEELLEGK